MSDPRELVSCGELDFSAHRVANNLIHQTGQARWGLGFGCGAYLAVESFVPTRQARWGQNTCAIVTERVLDGDKAHVRW